ncbi:MAG: hypothetical protein JNL62_00180 [Bryobacterales bacterium]|nr:hypothetical protein [Bryobacterales bacterium]
MMTLSLAWVRSVGKTKELIMAADSRLRAGRAWDVAPKILRLPRTDCAVCFAGDTDDAYPLMLSMASTIEDYPKSRTRATDIHDVKGHSLRVFNHLRTFISDLPTGQAESDPSKAEFIFGGFSWRQKKFAIWLLHYDSHIQRFTFRPASTWRGGTGNKQIMFAGDYVEEAKVRLIDLLKSRGKLTTAGFDMEPFEVLRDMIRDRSFRLIGGAPQVFKIYEFMNSQPYGVFWPSRQSGKVTILGRPLLDYEVTDHLVLDPDTLETHDLKGNTSLLSED